MTKTLIATAVVLALTGAACGGGGGGGGSDCTPENATKLTGTLTIKDFAFSPNCFSSPQDPPSRSRTVTPATSTR